MPLDYHAAVKYSYSSTRVRAMESKLISKDTMDELAKMKDIETMLARLLQTNYKDYIEEFGGLGARGELIDFALSKSLAVDAEKLIVITPPDERDTIRRIINRWDIRNIKLMLYAKSTGKNFEHISKYITPSRELDVRTIKEAMMEPDVTATISKLMLKPQYKDELKAALDAYKKTGNMTEVNTAIDKKFFSKLGGTIVDLNRISYESAVIVRLDIEMRNILTMLRAKRYRLGTDRLAALLIDNGMTPIDKLIRIYNASRDIREIVEAIGGYGLKQAYSKYQTAETKQMLTFEISIRNYIFKRAVSLLRHSVLSFASIVAYFYLKEMEIFKLRVLIKGMDYGLSGNETMEMLAWQT